jgi:mRNA interferase RelE/StbE
MLKLDISKQASEFVTDLGSKQAGQIAKRIFELLTNSRPNDSIALKGLSGVYRIDQGEFRIGYSFDSEFLYVIAIAPRNDDDIYKLLKRRIK